MVYKLGTLSELSKLPSMDEKICERIAENLGVLDDNYGSNRDVDKNNGGYVLYAEPETKDTEVLSWFDYEEYVPEYVDLIESEPKYYCSLYLISDDYGIVIFTALADTPESVTDEICRQDA